MNHIFICYAVEDEQFTHELVKTLKDKGFEIWASFDYNNLPGGTDIEKSIDVAIKQCSAFLLIYSSHAKTSEHVRSQWTRYRAEHGNRRLLPVRLANVRLPLPLKGINCFEVWKSYEAAVYGLLRMLDLYRTVPAPMAVTQGPFIMGTNFVPFGQTNETADLDAERDEDPQTIVEVDTFFISRSATTVAEFRPFVEGDGYKNSDYWIPHGWEWRKRNNIRTPLNWNVLAEQSQDMPVRGLSWYEAEAYCRWLAIQTGEAYKLPAEAEWEKAARGSDGRKWPWGNSWNAACVHYKDSFPHQPVPVDNYGLGRSVYGCLQMSGNVYEWCSSAYLPYPYDGEDGREDLHGYYRRVLRGGCWLSDKTKVRCAHRFCASPEARNQAYGFRLAVHV